jgi:hypothetical protein
MSPSMGQGVLVGPHADDAATALHDLGDHAPAR